MAPPFSPAHTAGTLLSSFQPKVPIEPAPPAHITIVDPNMLRMRKGCRHASVMDTMHEYLHSFKSLLDSRDQITVYWVHLIGKCNSWDAAQAKQLLDIEIYQAGFKVVLVCLGANIEAANVLLQIS